MSRPLAPGFAGAATLAERREADLFLAELLHGPSAARGVSSEASLAIDQQEATKQHKTDLFMADLFGEPARSAFRAAPPRMKALAAEDSSTVWPGPWTWKPAAHIPRPSEQELRQADREIVEIADEEGSAAVPFTFRIPAASGLGTSGTTAPIATVSPQRQMVELLDDELILIAKARILAEWVDRRVSSSVSQVLADAGLMQRLDLSRDAQLKARLRPWPGGAIPDRRAQLFPEDSFLSSRLRAPQAAADLERLLRFMHFYGLVLLPGITATPSRISDIMANITRVEGRMQRERFDRAAPAIEAFATTFKQKIANGALADAVVERESMPQDWSPKLAADARRLAKPVVDLLRRVRALDSAWLAGLYPRHWWNEFSADIFLASGFDGRQFYQVPAVRRFFDKLDEACRQTAPPGPFAWKAIYNDDPLRTELDQKFGAGRVLNAPKHGPGPDIHIHLDLRPLSIPLDAQTGFKVEDGRVVLL